MFVELVPTFRGDDSRASLIQARTALPRTGTQVWTLALEPVEFVGGGGSAAVSDETVEGARSAPPCPQHPQHHSPRSIFSSSRPSRVVGRSFAPPTAFTLWSGPVSRFSVSRLRLDRVQLRDVRWRLPRDEVFAGLNRFAGLVRIVVCDGSAAGGHPTVDQRMINFFFGRC